MGTLLVAHMFLFCYERVFMLSPPDNNQADVVEAFNSSPRLVVRHSNSGLLLGNLPTCIVLLPTLAQFSHAVCQVVHVSLKSPYSVLSIN